MEIEEIEETDFYDILGVPSTASEEDIRNAYLLKARQVHPDKNPDDPTAGERFQRVNEAYQALSDPDQREAYDIEHGYRTAREDLVDDPTDEDLVNPTQGLVDPTEAFKDYIGDLAVGANAFSLIVATEKDNPQNLSHKLKSIMQGVQKNREERLAGTLQVLLDQYVNGDKDSFAHQALLEAKRLSGSADQADLLHIIGYTYATQAAQELGKRVSLGVPFLTWWVRNKLRYWKLQNITKKEVFKMAKIQEEINRSGEDDNETLMKLLWKLNAADVEVTLSRVCQMVLHDSDATKEEIKERAMALRTLGIAFLRQQAAGNDGAGTSRGKEPMGEIAAESHDDMLQAQVRRRLRELPRALSFRAILIQSVGGLLGCLCNPASESDADDCNPAATDREADDSNPAPDREAAEAE